MPLRRAARWALRREASLSLNSGLRAAWRFRSAHGSRCPDAASGSSASPGRGGRLDEPKASTSSNLRATAPEAAGHTLEIVLMAVSLAVAFLGIAFAWLFYRKDRSLPERLVVPFEAVKAFYDPSAQFGLQFGKPGAANDLARQHMATAMPDLVADADEAAHQRPETGQAHPLGGGLGGKRGPSTPMLYCDRPLDPGHRERRDLYNLYHVLNHLNLFGGGYLRQAQEMIDRLLAAA